MIKNNDNDDNNKNNNDYIKIKKRGFTINI